MFSRTRLLVAAILIFAFSKLYGQGLIIDHSAVTMFDQIPDYWLEKAKELTIHYGHTSHGSQIIAGLNYLRDQVDSVKYKVTINDRNPERKPDLPTQEDPPALRMWEEGLWPYTDPGKRRLGYWDGQAAQEGTREVLKSGLFNISGWSWCGEVANNDSIYIQNYLDVMATYEREFPNLKFFYMTGHCVAPGPPNFQQVAYERLQSNNNKIREYCRNNNKILFDFADIEAWDLAGNYHPEEDASCVWCEEWCNNHPEDCQNIPERSESGGGSNCTTCAHTHGLNCVIKAKAFWYMMARLAGWDGQISASVEFIKLEGHLTKEGVTLNWKTASEYDNYGFEIERSKEGVLSFKKIGFVNGNGTTDTIKSYRFIDKNVTKGTYNYRLKQIDNDGNVYYLGTIQIHVGLPVDIRLNQNYPNPFNAATAISYCLPKRSQVQLTIFDVNSKVVATLVDELQKAGFYNILWNASKFPSGQYFYQIKTTQFVETKRMLLVK